MGTGANALGSEGGLAAPITIREAEPGDAKRIAEIHVASWHSTYRGLLPNSYLDTLGIEQRLPMWERMLESAPASTHVWVAVVDGEIVGFCSIGPSQSLDGDNGDTLEIYTIYLRPEHQRRGIGTGLLQQAERKMNALGASTAILWVLRDNLSARRFYEASGWNFDGIEKLDEIWGQALHEVRYSKRLS